MEGNSNNGSEQKHKPRVAFSESNSPREGTSSLTTVQWHDGHQRHGKRRERSRDREWNRDRNFAKKSENFLEEESGERFREEPQLQSAQPTPSQTQAQAATPQAASSYPAYGYNAPDQTFADSNRRALTMMSTYNLFAGMNPQWGMNPLDMSVNSTSAGIPMVPGMDMTPNSASGMNPFAFMGMPGDSNMFGMMGMGNFCQYGMNGQETGMIVPPKEIIQLSKSVLYPPNPNAPPPTTRDKPPGCKTVFVGGLPENATEEIINEVFERCGEIVTIRMSKKNFCHIRFASESFVESAIYFSGYRIKIENKDEAAYSGRLHVDYAQARDDQYEYECQQRALQREARHRARMEKEYYGPPTPPPVVHYSDHEATVLGDKLRGEDTFQQAIFILITWLERGECNKRNAGFFYSMIQSTNSHVRRLMNEKLKYEDELNKARIMLKQQMQGILLQFHEIGKVFCAASLQKVWDHFTKAQRKNIEMWKKQHEEIKNAHVEEVLNDRIEDEMEVSDDDDSSKTQEDSSDNQKDLLQEEVNKLKEENDSIRCQFEASQNEIMILRSEAEQEKDFNERQLQAMRQAVQGLQKELLTLTQRRAKDEAELKEFRAFKVRRRDAEKDENNDAEKDHSDIDHQRDLGFGSSVSSTSGLALTITEADARLIGLISTFLNVHPFGASIDYICSYLHQIDFTIRGRDVENLMKRFPSVFNEESTGIGASLEKKWTFSGFK